MTLRARMGAPPDGRRPVAPAQLRRSAANRNCGDDHWQISWSPGANSARRNSDPSTILRR